MNKKVYGYVRVSTDTQVEYGHGIDTQENAIRKYCNDNNLELVKIFYDHGRSGAFKLTSDEENISNRPGLQELLQSINGINTVIVMSTSRLWRNETAKVVIIREMKKLNGSIISLDNLRYDIYATDPSDKLFNAIMEALDEYERLTINLRLAKGRINRARQGYKSGGLQPFGYEYSQDKKSTIINQYQANVIRDIFQMRIDGLSLNQIADKLNSKEYTKKHKNAYKKPKNWINQSVDKILKNDYYIGVLTYADEKFHGNHEPIIDMDTWNSIHKNIV